MIFRAKHKQLGSHVHIQLFSAKATNMTFANIGTLVMEIPEWAAFRAILEAGRVEITDGV